MCARTTLSKKDLREIAEELEASTFEGARVFPPGEETSATRCRSRPARRAARCRRSPCRSEGRPGDRWSRPRELPNGNLFVTWSDNGRFDEITKSGTLLRKITTTTAIAYLEHGATMYGPPPPYDR